MYSVTNYTLIIVYSRKLWKKCPLELPRAQSDVCVLLDSTEIPKSKAKSGKKWQIEISKWLLIIGQSTNLSCDRFKNKNTAASIEDILKSHILLLDHWLVVCHKNIHHYHCHSLTLFVLHLWQYDRHFLCNEKLTWGEKINFQEVFCVTLLLFLKTQMITCLCTVGGSP